MGSFAGRRKLTTVGFVLQSNASVVDTLQVRVIQFHRQLPIL